MLNSGKYREKAGEQFGEAVQSGEGKSEDGGVATRRASLVLKSSYAQAFRFVLSLA
jgi:hypothetical protein